MNYTIIKVTNTTAHDYKI